MTLTAEQKIEQVAEAMREARAKALAVGHVCNFNYLSRAAIAEMKAIVAEERLMHKAGHTNADVC